MGKMKLSEALNNAPSNMKWYSILVYLLMPICSVLSFVVGAVYFFISLITVDGIASMFKMDDKVKNFIVDYKGVEEGEKIARAEINEFGMFLFTFALLIVAIGVFTLACRSSLLFYENKSIMMTFILYLASAAISLVTVLYLFLFDYAFILMIPFLILGAVQIAFGIFNYLYLKKRSYEFTI